MINWLIGKIRDRKLGKEISDQADFYSRDWSPEDIRTWQLNQFNEQWRVICQEVPYFVQLVCDRNLPKKFESWKQFKDSVPVTDREMVQKHRNDLTNATRSPNFWRITGGSTAEPVQIPAWSSERKYERKNFWYARGWYDIKPSDKLFLIWGHSHIFGEGIRGWWNRSIREFKDHLLGYYRANAYDLSDEALKQVGQKLLHVQPKYVIGYSNALDQFARANKHLSRQFHRLDLKAVIATAEAFPRSDSSEYIESILGAPVAMEYGTVETGPIAYQGIDGDFRIFWRDYKVEGKSTDLLGGAYEIYITSLYPRCFPLVRYRIGDLVIENPNSTDFNQKFSTLIGRCNDYIELPDGKRIHSESITHAIKDINKIASYQVKQSKNKIIMYYVSKTEKPLNFNTRKKIRKRLSNVNPHLEKIKIVLTRNLDKTPAGKTKRIVRDR